MGFRRPRIPTWLEAGPDEAAPSIMRPGTKSCPGTSTPTQIRSGTTCHAVQPSERWPSCRSTPRRTAGFRRWGAAWEGPQRRASGGCQCGLFLRQVAAGAPGGVPKFTDRFSSGPSHSGKQPGPGRGVQFAQFSVHALAVMWIASRAEYQRPTPTSRLGLPKGEGLAKLPRLAQAAVETSRQQHRPTSRSGWWAGPARGRSARPAVSAGPARLAEPTEGFESDRPAMPGRLGQPRGVAVANLRDWPCLPVGVCETVWQRGGLRQ